MRIVTGAFSHETNVFSTARTSLEEFRNGRLLYGDEIISFFNGTKTPMGGFMDGCKELGIELIPTIFASATPSGIITAEAYDAILHDLLEGIRKAGEIDGVALHLHGADVSEKQTDADGFILSEVRRLVGNKPIVVTLDFHANYSRPMLENADLLIGYDTYPHVDGYERGVEAIKLMKRLVDGDLKPRKALKQPPMLPALQVQYTGRHPMGRLIEEAHRMEAMDSVETITVAAGFPWSDVHYAGLSVIVTTNDDQRLADDLACELNDLAWGLRRGFLVNLTPMKEALRKVKTAKEGPIVLADIGDNPGGGSPCDGTVVLKAVLEEGLRGGVFGVISDPESAEKASEAGTGSQLTLNLGGKIDTMHGSPITVTGVVKLISNGKWVAKGPMGTGAQVDMGKTVVLETEGNELIITTKRLQPTDLQLYRSVGIEPMDKRFIVVKSSVHYRASHEPIAKDVIEMDTPGLTSPRLLSFNFRNLRRPIFPLDIETLNITELKNMEDE